MVGPEFSFTANPTQSFTPNQADVWLALVPGAVAVVCGLLIAGTSRTIVGRLRPDLWMLGAVTVFTGAWFAIGQFAWPAMGGTRYIAQSDATTYLWKQFGFTVGVGLLLVLLGAVVMGWAGRRSLAAPVSGGRIVPMPTAAPVATEPVAPATGPVAYQPAYQQPGYAQPGYAQPGYQQPGAYPPPSAVPPAAEPVTQAQPVVQEYPGVVQEHPGMVQGSPAVVHESRLAERPTEAPRRTVPAPPD